MQCEVCGRQILGKPYNVVIEGAKMLACFNCARLGSVYREPPPSTSSVKRVVKPPKVPRSRPVLPQTFELVEDFDLRVRQARESLGLNHEELGKKIGEKVSVLRKIESGRMAPDNQLANKLQQALKIQLLVPFSEPKIQPLEVNLPPKATLGQVAFRKGKNLEEDTERESS